MVSAGVSLRGGQPGEDFVRAVFAQTHGAQFAAVPLEPAALAELLRMQFEAQQRQYLANYPDSVDSVITLDDAPVGRCWVNHAATEIRLLDLAVLPVHQRRGIARAVLEQLAGQARDAGRPLRLSVWQDNVGARELYRRHGFRPVDQAGGYLQLEWMAPLARAS